MTLDMEHLTGWIGRSEVMREHLSPELVGRFNATLGTSASCRPGEAAPLLIHFCLAQPAKPADQLGPDGHHRSQSTYTGSEVRGAFLGVGMRVGLIGTIPR